MTPKERSLSAQLTTAQVQADQATLARISAETARDQSDAMLRTTQADLAATTTTLVNLANTVEDATTLEQVKQVVREGRTTGGGSGRGGIPPRVNNQ